MINKTQNQKKKTSKLKKLILPITIFVKIIFHYVDVISDINVIIFFINLFVKTIGSLAMIFTGACVMNLFSSMAADRIFSHFYITNLMQECKMTNTNNQGEKEIKQQDNVQKKKIPLKDHIISGIVILLFFDYVYITILTRKQEAQKQFQNIRKKALIELVCENYLYLMASTLAFMIKYINEEELQVMDYIAIFTSFGSTVKTVYSLIIERYNEQQYLKEKSEIKYSEMTIETQRYLSTPFLLSFYKQMSQDKYQYSQLTHPQNTKFEQQKPIPIYKKILLIFIICLDIITMLLTIEMVMVVDGLISQMIRFNDGYFMSYPFYCLYFITFTKNKQQKYIQEQKQNDKPISKNTLKNQLLYFFAFYPYVYVLGAMHLKFPVGNQAYPFFPEIKQNWVQNFMPSTYTILCRFIQEARDILFLYYIYYNKVETNLMVAFSDTEQKREERIFSDDNLVLQGFKIGVIGFILQVIIYSTGFTYNYLYLKKNQKQQATHIQQIQQNNQSQVNQKQILNGNKNSKQYEEKEISIIPNNNIKNNNIQKNSNDTSIQQDQKNNNQSQRIKKLSSSIFSGQDLSINSSQVDLNFSNNNIKTQNFVFINQLNSNTLKNNKLTQKSEI